MSRVYPAGYQPADAIYTKNITDNDKWTKSSIFYLSNPQLLVIEASKGRISPSLIGLAEHKTFVPSFVVMINALRFPMAP